MYLFSRVKAVPEANWALVSLHVSGAVERTCLLSLLHLLVPNGGFLVRQRAGISARTGLCSTSTVPHLVPLCRAMDGSLRTQLLLQCSGWEDVWVAQLDPGLRWRMGIISLSNLELVTSVCTSQYSREWDGTNGSAASWHIISHLPQPLALKWGPGYGPTEGKLW